MNKKRMLLYSHLFYPEVASTAQIYTDLCIGLKDEFDITVISAVPCYSGVVDDKYKKRRIHEETYNGIRIFRVRVKSFNKKNRMSRINHILSYFINAIIATKKVGKQDVVFACSQPPILGGMLGVIGKRVTKGKLIYNIQDFNPEQTMAIRYAGNKFMHKVMMWFDKRSCRKADLVITVGRDMQETLRKRFNNQNVPNNIVINNWIDETQVYPLSKEHARVAGFRNEYGLDNKFVIMYSGNIGLYYDLDNIIKLVKKYREHDKVVFALVGDGALKERLEQYAYDNAMHNVVFIPYQQKDDLIYSLNAADVHLVSNAKGIKGVSVPSKIYGVMATNVPAIGILERETEAWRIIADSQSGVLAEAATYNEVESILDEVIEQQEEFVRRHQTGRAYVVEHFTMGKSIRAYAEAIDSLQSKN